MDHTRTEFLVKLSELTYSFLIADTELTKHEVLEILGLMASNLVEASPAEQRIGLREIARSTISRQLSIPMEPLREALLVLSDRDALNAASKPAKPVLTLIKSEVTNG